MPAPRARGRKGMRSFDAARYRQATDMLRKAHAEEARKGEEEAQKVVAERQKREKPKTAEEAVARLQSILAMGYHRGVGFTKSARGELRVLYAWLPKKERQNLARMLLEAEELPNEIKAQIFHEFRQIELAERRRGVH